MYTLEQILISVFLFLFAISGLVIYIIVIRVLMTKFSKKSYFLLASWLGVADCISLISSICYTTPSLLLDKKIHPSNVFGGVVNIGWFSGLPLMVFLAGDRYLCICHPKLHNKLYNKKYTKYYCLSAWLFGACYALPSFFDGCNVFYNVEVRSFTWNIPESCAAALSYGELGMMIIIAGILCACNGLVLRYLQKIRKSLSLNAIHVRRQVARERKIFFQFAVITAIFLVFDISFITIGYLPEPSKWFGLAVSILLILNSSINGWVYLIMNQMIRGEIRRMFRRILRIQSSKNRQSEITRTTTYVKDISSVDEM